MLKQLLSYTFTLFSVLFATTLAAAPQKGVMAMDAQARVMPPNAKNSAAYFTLMRNVW